MRELRIVVALIAALVVSACAGPAPKQSVLDPATRASLKISEVTVDTSKMGPKTQGRALPAANVNAALRQAAGSLLRGQGNGPRKARAQIVIDNVSIITAGQSIVLGGESVMAGTVSLVDARTGQLIFPATKVTSGGGGWVAGGIIAAATQEDPNTEVRQMSQEFVSRARVLMLGHTQPITSQASGGAVKEVANAKRAKDAQNAGLTTYEADKKADAERQAKQAKCRTTITISCTRKADAE